MAFALGVNPARVQRGTHRGRNMTASIAPASRDRRNRGRRSRVSVQASKHIDSWSFRDAEEKDGGSIFRMVLNEKMNPLGLDYTRFLVAVADDGEVLGFGQVEPKPSAEDKQYMEFRTLIVREQYRGLGIGTSIAEKLLEKVSDEDVYMTTIKRTIGLYEKLGFTQVEEEEMPRAIWFEWKVGNIVAQLAVGDQCIVMYKPAGQKD